MLEGPKKQSQTLSDLMQVREDIRQHVAVKRIYDPEEIFTNKLMEMENTADDPAVLSVTCLHSE